MLKVIYAIIFNTVFYDIFFIKNTLIINNNIIWIHTNNRHV